MTMMNSDTHSGDTAHPVSIDTPRLILREARLADLESMHAMLTDPAVTWYMPAMRSYDHAESEAWLRSIMRDQEVSLRLRYSLIAEDRATSLPCGCVTLNLIDSAPDGAHFVLGYFMKPDVWNQGYATEAVQATLSYIFSENGWRVTASCLAENLGSRRVLEKCGLRLEGMMLRHTWHDGQWKDCMVYGLIRPDYERRQSDV